MASDNARLEHRFHKIATLNEILPDEKLFIEINGMEIVVININGELFAIGDKCTHDGGPLGDGIIEGYQIVCPRHGARFDVRNGRALTLPAVKDTPSYPVKIDGNDVLLGIPYQKTSQIS